MEASVHKSHVQPGSYLIAVLKAEVRHAMHKGLWPLSRSQFMSMNANDLEGRVS